MMPSKDFCSSLVASHSSAFRTIVNTKMNVLQRFKEFIGQQNLFHQRDKLILAVSGGVDSVVLCELCKQAGYDFIIAHCNFQLRGKESERDKEFVKALGEKYKVEVRVKDFDTEKYAQENKKGIQEAARDLRYEWFAEIVNRDPDSHRESVVSRQTSNVKRQKESSFHVSRLTSHVS